MNFSSLFGLPAHPLLVHLPVVLTPLTAIGAIAIAASGRLRRRWGVVILALVFVSFVGAFLAKESGEKFERAVPESQLIEDHAELGDLAPVAVFAMLVATGGLVATDLVGRRRGEARSVGAAAAPSAGSSGASSAPKAVVAVFAVLTVLTSVAATWHMTRVGHSGAKAVWDGVDVEKSQNKGDDGD